MTTLLAESYSRAYGSFVMAQQLSELEEIVEYKQLLKQIGAIKSLSESDKVVEENDTMESMNQANPAAPATGSSMYRLRNSQGLSVPLSHFIPLLAHQHSNRELNINGFNGLSCTFCS
jgi:hypothetical protein